MGISVYSVMSIYGWYNWELEKKEYHFSPNFREPQGKKNNWYYFMSAERMIVTYLVVSKPLIHEIKLKITSIFLP